MRSFRFCALVFGAFHFFLSASLFFLQTVSRAATLTAVTSSINPSVFGQNVTFTATVSAVAPGAGIATGQVTFLDGGAFLGIGLLDATGKATLQTTTLAVGTHLVTALYAGDSNFNASTSAVLNQVVNPGARHSSLAAPLDPSVAGLGVTFKGTVSVLLPDAALATSAACGLARDPRGETQSIELALALRPVGSTVPGHMLERVWTEWKESWLNDALLGELALTGLA